MPITIYQNVHLDETKLLTPPIFEKDYIGVVVTRLIQLKHAVALSFFVFLGQPSIYDMEAVLTKKSSKWPFWGS